MIFAMNDDNFGMCVHNELYKWIMFDYGVFGFHNLPAPVVYFSYFEDDDSLQENSAVWKLNEYKHFRL